MVRLVRELWAGNVPLARAFWEYAVLYTILINAAATMGSLALWSMGQIALGMVVHLAPLPYETLVLIAVWRSAGKYAADPNNNPIWATLARATVTILVVLCIVF